ncbi:MAG: IS21 family transposase [Treponema sp.]|nr:IS21 family transposase [Candidatus Treponema scatequi]
MLTMPLIESIRRKYQEGVPITQIAKEENVDYKTVRKYIDMEDFSQNIEDYVRTQKAKIIDPYVEELTNLLNENKKNWHKQRLTSQRVFDILKEKHPEAEISYYSVNRFVKTWKIENIKKNEAGFSHLKWYPGEAQADFGEADFIWLGTKLRLKYFVLSFPYSNVAYCQLFRGENCECVCQALINLFEYIGGVPKVIVFDNATGIGHRFGKILKENPLFQRFRVHYGFESRFCNPNSGHEKGSVESNVGYLRRNIFVPMIKIPEDIEEFNLTDMLCYCEKLMEKRIHYIHKVPVFDLFEKDREALLPHPPKKFEAKQILERKADNYANVTLDGNHRYTLPPEYRNTQVLVETWAWKVAIYDMNAVKIEEYDREYGQDSTESVSARTGIASLVRKPGMWSNSVFRSNLATDNPFREYLDSVTDADIKHKVFYEFHKAMDEWPYCTVLKAFTELAARNLDLTSRSNVSVYCSRIESCPVDFSFNPTGVSLDKYGSFMKFDYED